MICCLPFDKTHDPHSLLNKVQIFPHSRQAHHFAAETQSSEKGTDNGGEGNIMKRKELLKGIAQIRILGVFAGMLPILNFFHASY